MKWKSTAAFLDEGMTEGYDELAQIIVSEVRPILQGVDSEAAKINGDRYLNDVGKAAKVTVVIDGAVKRIAELEASLLGARRTPVLEALAAMDKAAGAELPKDPLAAVLQQMRHAEIRARLGGFDALAIESLHGVANDETALAMELAPLMIRQVSDGFEVIPPIPRARVEARRRSRALAVAPEVVARLDALREEEDTIRHLAARVLGELQHAAESLTVVSE